MSPLAGLFGGQETEKRQNDNKYYGAVLAVVTDIVHSDGPTTGEGSVATKDYRIRVKYPFLPGSDQSFWARMATFSASPNGVGAWWMPEVNDEVVVVFEMGDFDKPIVIGSLWNSMAGDTPPAYCEVTGDSQTKRYQNNDAKFKAKTEPKKNDMKSISFRKGHELIFNNNADEPRVCVSSGQKHRIVLDDKGNEPNKIEIYDGKEENYILIDTKNKKITMETKTGDILIKAKKTVRIECEKLETNSDKDTEMTVGKNYTMQASSNMTMKASGSGDIESSGTMTIKGSTVNIN
jgi:uncharacterized protein involved in type VI secretion and phage assembly